MTLTTGDQAPDFTLVTLREEGPTLVTLKEELASSKVLLLFVPMAFTGVCTEEFCSLSHELSDYENLGVKVLGVSGDNPFAQAAWAEKEGISLTLLSDYEHEVAAAYGVAYDEFLPEKNLIMGGVAKRSAFLINQEGAIEYAEVLDNPGELPNFEKIKSHLEG